MKLLKNSLNLLFMFFIAVTIFFISMYIYAISLPKIDLNNINNVTIYDNKNELLKKLDERSNTDNSKTLEIVKE